MVSGALSDKKIFNKRYLNFGIIFVVNKIKLGMSSYRFFFISIMLFLVSCTGGVENPSKKGLIPEKKLGPILSELQLTDGLLSSPFIRDWGTIIDTATAYHSIIEKHGYTKEALDKTLHYYFLKKPKKLITIYEETLAKFSEMESILDKQIKIEMDRTSNIWPGEKDYYYPFATTGHPDFEVSIFGNNDYLLRFTATLFPDDQSVNAKSKLFAVRTDSLLSGKRFFFETPDYIKDGRPHTYQVRISINQNGWFSIKGSLYDITNNVENGQRHIILEDIALRIPPSDL